MVTHDSPREIPSTDLITDRVRRSRASRSAVERWLRSACGVAIGLGLTACGPDGLEPTFFPQPPTAQPPEGVPSPTPGDDPAAEPNAKSPQADPDDYLAPDDPADADGPPEGESDVDDEDPPIDDVVVDDPPADDVPYPFVLVHGFGAFADIGPIDGFFGVPEHLASLDLDGRPLQVASAPLPPIAGTVARTAALATFVDETLASTGAEKVFLLCHSQGGIDCRALIDEPTHEGKVAAIVTIGTPHYGTPLADLAAEAPPGLLNPAGQFFAALLGLAQTPPTDDDWQLGNVVENAQAGDVQAVLDAMTTAGAAAFNAEHPLHPTVPTYSIAGVSRLSDGGPLCEGGALYPSVDQVDPLQLPLVMTGLLIARSGEGLPSRDNDGVVPTDSMPFGTFLGCVGADHLEEIGQPAGGGLLSSFDHLQMYEDLAMMLRGNHDEG